MVPWRPRRIQAKAGADKKKSAKGAGLTSISCFYTLSAVVARVDSLHISVPPTPLNIVYSLGMVLARLERAGPVIPSVMTLPPGKPQLHLILTAGKN